MKFRKFDKIILFGAGWSAGEFALVLKSENIKFLVVTSERHLREEIKVGSTWLNYKELLDDNKIDYHSSHTLNEDNDVIGRITNATLGISLGSASIFNDSFIKRFNGALVNVHGTRLPQNRGGGAFSWQILRNNRLGYNMIHRVDPGVDTGPIIKYSEFFYPPSCRTPYDYKDLYTKRNLSLLKEFLKDVRSEKEFTCINQQEYFSTYWPRLHTDIHGFVDWSWPLKDIELFICAFDSPYRGASTFINERRVFLKNCFTDFNDGSFHPFQKGIVYRKAESALYIATESGTLIVKDAKDENNRDIIKEISIGDRLYTPSSYLEKARQYRAVYTPKGLLK